MGEVVFFQPRDRFAASSAQPECYCRDLTSGSCAVCVEKLGQRSSPTVAIKMDIADLDGIVQALRTEMARLLRKAADREAGPVGERLRQIAQVFEVTDGTC